jgi:hypothetical protein
MQTSSLMKRLISYFPPIILSVQISVLTLLTTNDPTFVQKRTQLEVGNRYMWSISGMALALFPCYYHDPFRKERNLRMGGTILGTNVRSFGYGIPESRNWVWLHQQSYAHN